MLWKRTSVKSSLLTSDCEGKATITNSGGSPHHQNGCQLWNGSRLQIRWDPMPESVPESASRLGRHIKERGKMAVTRQRQGDTVKEICPWHVSKRVRRLRIRHTQHGRLTAPATERPFEQCHWGKQWAFCIYVPSPVSGEQRFSSLPLEPHHYSTCPLSIPALRTPGSTQCAYYHNLFIHHALDQLIRRSIDEAGSQSREKMERHMCRIEGASRSRTVNHWFGG